MTKKDLALRPKRLSTYSSTFWCVSSMAVRKVCLCRDGLWHMLSITSRCHRSPLRWQSRFFRSSEGLADFRHNRLGLATWHFQLQISRGGDQSGLINMATCAANLRKSLRRQVPSPSELTIKELSSWDSSEARKTNEMRPWIFHVSASFEPVCTRRRSSAANMPRHTSSVYFNPFMQPVTL